jgi:hypothetical protein
MEAVGSSELLVPTKLLGDTFQKTSWYCRVHWYRRFGRTLFVPGWQIWRTSPKRRCPTKLLDINQVLTPASDAISHAWTFSLIVYVLQLVDLLSSTVHSTDGQQLPSGEVTVKQVWKCTCGISVLVHLCVYPVNANFWCCLFTTGQRGPPK